MRFIIILSLVLMSSVSVSAAGTGDIQIYCEPGVEIYIDGHFRDKTNDFDEGLYVEGLTPGRHSLKAVKPGYKPALQDFDIKAYQSNTPIKLKFEDREYKVRKLESEVEETVAKVGSFELMSAPEGSKVYLDGNYIGTSNIAVDDIAIGKHKIKFEKKGRVLEGLFSLVKRLSLKLILGRIQLLISVMLRIIAKQKILTKSY